MNWFGYVWMGMLGIPYIAWIINTILETVNLFFFHKRSSYYNNYIISPWTDTFWLIHIFAIFMLSAIYYIIHC